MRGIDGSVRVLAPEDGHHVRWPANAVCDVSVTSEKGPSAAVYLGRSDVGVLVKQLGAFLPPNERHPAHYPATPVDCLLSELREMFGWDGSQTMTLADFEARVLQFKEEVGEG